MVRFLWGLNIAYHTEFFQNNVHYSTILKTLMQNFNFIKKALFGELTKIGELTESKMLVNQMLLEYWRGHKMERKSLT